MDPNRAFKVLSDNKKFVATDKVQNTTGDHGKMKNLMTCAAYVKRAWLTSLRYAKHIQYCTLQIGIATDPVIRNVHSQR